MSKGKIIAAVATVLFIAIMLLITGLKAHHDIPLDRTYGTPPPPDLPYPVNNNIGATIVMTVIGLSGVALGIIQWVRTKSPLPLMIALSGAVICIPEVFFDVMGGVYFPWSATEPLGQAYAILGREMPWWIAAGWFGYGAFNFFMFTLLASKPSTKTIWLMLGGAAVGDVVFEEILLSFNVYHYYGNQPLVIVSQLPWWWIPCNSIGVFLAAALAYRFQDFLRGWRSLLMLVITPLSVTTVYGAIALPSWIAVNGNYPWLPTQILGLATIALGIVVFALILELVLKRKPFELGYTPAKDVAEFGSPVQGRIDDRVSAVR
ncbi:hypothetical protein [Amycolatopsis acididurans]|uniref:hypothetical protein n=1 Tax=Amycolatopsis acididurans TaxID=2724524 RepID=UPI001B33E7F2|nr:hypothetical protein [Amycolatopsis acididurans]